MTKLKVRTLVRKKRPNGRFNYIVHLNRTTNDPKYASTNASEIEKMRDLLRGTLGGRYKLEHALNYQKRRVYTCVYLENPMDLAMLKLVHSDQIFKIYKIVVPDTVEQLSDSDQRTA